MSVGHRCSTGACRLVVVVGCLGGGAGARRQLGMGVVHGRILVATVPAKILPPFHHLEPGEDLRRPIGSQVVYGEVNNKVICLPLLGCLATPPHSMQGTLHQQAMGWWAVGLGR